MVIEGENERKGNSERRCVKEDSERRKKGGGARGRDRKRNREVR